MKIAFLFTLSAALIGVASTQANDKVLLYDFETTDQHREPNLPSTTPPGWGSFGAVTLDRGPASELTEYPPEWVSKGTFPASAGDWARYQKGDFDLPWDLSGNYGLINVSDRFPGYRKDFSGFTGLSVDAMFLSDAVIPFEGVAEIEIGFGFIMPGVGVEDEEKSVYGPPQLLTDAYQTYTVNYSEMNFVQSPEELAVELAQFAFIKIRVSNTEFNSGLGTFVYDEVYGLLGTSVGESADFDGDGDVDGRDFLTWQRGFGLSGQTDNSLGDANFDGVVDGLDLEVWQDQYGQIPMMSSINTVPECDSITMALFAALALIVQVRTRGV